MEKLLNAPDILIVMEKTADEKKQDMEIGKADEDVYTAEGREKLVEDGEISPREAAFMQGAEGKGELGNCATCGKPIGDSQETVVEKKVKGELIWFCCNDCAENYQK